MAVRLLSIKCSDGSDKSNLSSYFCQHATLPSLTKNNNLSIIEKLKESEIEIEGERGESRTGSPPSLAIGRAMEACLA